MKHEFASIPIEPRWANAGQSNRPRPRHTCARFLLQVSLKAIRLPLSFASLALANSNVRETYTAAHHHDDDDDDGGGPWQSHTCAPAVQFIRDSNCKWKASVCSVAFFIREYLFFFVFCDPVIWYICFFFYFSEFSFGFLFIYFVCAAQNFISFDIHFVKRINNNFRLNGRQCDEWSQSVYLVFRVAACRKVLYFFWKYEPVRVCVFAPQEFEFELISLFIILSGVRTLVACGFRGLLLAKTNKRKGENKENA